jgi:hypothetical protein
VTRTVVVDPVFAQAGRPNVAVSVENGEHGAILEYSDSFLDWRPSRRDVKLSFDTNFNQWEPHLKWVPFRLASAPKSRKVGGTANSF